MSPGPNTLQLLDGRVGALESGAANFLTREAHQADLQKLESRVQSLELKWKVAVGVAAVLGVSSGYLGNRLGKANDSLVAIEESIGKKEDALAQIEAARANAVASLPAAAASAASETESRLSASVKASVDSWLDAERKARRVRILHAETEFGFLPIKVEEFGQNRFDMKDFDHMVRASITFAEPVDVVIPEQLAYTDKWTMWKVERNPKEPSGKSWVVSFQAHSTAAGRPVEDSIRAFGRFVGVKFAD